MWNVSVEYEMKFAPRGYPVLFLAGMLVVLAVSLVSSVYSLAAGLVWQTSGQTAVSLAQQQGKKILMLASTDTCWPFPASAAISVPPVIRSVSWNSANGCA